MSADLELTATRNLAGANAGPKAAWDAGDVARIARPIENVAEEFMARQLLPPGARVLDVGCGKGDLAIIAARRGCVVCGIDSSSDLIAQARARVVAEDLRIDFDEGDVEALPFSGCRFDLVVSMFGVMFAPRPELAASELLRVTRPGGRIALASWTAEGFVGRMFNVFSAHVPPSLPGVPSPLGWGDEATVYSRLGEGFTVLRLARRLARLCDPLPPAEMVEFFRRHGPTQRAFALLDASAQARFCQDLADLQAAHNVATAPGATEVDAEYLEVIAARE